MLPPPTCAPAHLHPPPPPLASRPLSPALYHPSYYYEANKADLPAVPDLSDGSGGLSNTSYFNFTMYVLYKIVAKHVTGAAERAAFCADAGAELAELLWPAAAARGEAALPRCARHALQHLPAYAPQQRTVAGRAAERGASMPCSAPVHHLHQRRGGEGGPPALRASSSPARRLALPAPTAVQAAARARGRTASRAC